MFEHGCTIHVPGFIPHITSAAIYINLPVNQKPEAFGLADAVEHSKYYVVCVLIVLFKLYMTIGLQSKLCRLLYPGAF
jgi:hypothetical protein